MSIFNFNRFKPQKAKKEGKPVETSELITLTPVLRKKNLDEDARKRFATELLDTYAGFGTYYLKSYLEATVNNGNIKNEMKNIARCLPLLKKFIDSISRIYSEQPTRKFYIDGKLIVKEQNKIQNDDNVVVNENLYETLNNLYNDSLLSSIKQAEKYTNLLGTTIYKVITEGENIRLLFIPNDSIQVNKDVEDNTKAEQVSYIQDVENLVAGKASTFYKTENWTANEKIIVDNFAINQKISQSEPKPNYAAEMYEKLFDTKRAGDIFAPFVVFRSSGDYIDFWDIKDMDIVNFIKSLNVSLTELRYLEKYTSFSLKYAVNLNLPKQGVMDATGFLDLSVANNNIPGIDAGKNWDIGEFRNEGRIDEVIRSIIFNLKMLYSLYNIPLDALISTNSVRSAESKEMDNEELYSAINAQRDIWQENEQNLFKVMCAVHNRDNINQIPRGVELIVDYTEKSTAAKTQEEWLVEIQNNVKTYIDWLGELNPDLDQDELIRLFKENKSLNENEVDEEETQLNLAEEEETLDQDNNNNSNNDNNNSNNDRNNSNNTTN